MRLMLQEADRTTTNGDIGSHHVCSYVVTGLPSPENAKIAYLDDAWRILRWNDAWHGNWSGHYETAEAALDALREEILKPAA
jgi:hypothetical protein